MKKIIFTLYALAHGIIVFAQNDQQKETEVRAMEIAEATALLQKDIPALQRIWSPEFMVNAPLNMVFIGGQVEMVRTGFISYSSFVRNVEHVMVLKDVVITMGSETVVPTSPDPMAGQTIQRRYTNIWMKEKGNWVLMARHASNICPAAGISATQKNTGEHGLRDFNIRVSKNPSPDHFQLNFQSFGKMQILVTDSHGRLVEKRDVANGTATVLFGENYQEGIYFAQITDGVNLKTVKLVKL